MPEPKLPPSLAIVVESEVLGTVAVSVEAHPGCDERELGLYVLRSDVEDAVDAEETRYLDSHQNLAQVSAKVHTVPAAPFQQKAQVLIDQGMTWDGFADKMGWWRKAKDRADQTRPDGDKVRYYILGWRDERREDIPADIARDLCDALDMDPVDVGL